MLYSLAPRLPGRGIFLFVITHVQTLRGSLGQIVFNSAGPIAICAIGQPNSRLDLFCSLNAAQRAQRDAQSPGRLFACQNKINVCLLLHL